MSGLLLSARGLEIWRGERLICQDLDFDVAAGQLGLFQGPNGAGKTTLIRTVVGLGRLESGEISWCGKPVRKYRTEFTTEVAYVGHMPGVKGALTPLENLRMDRSLMVRRTDCNPEAALERVGLAHFMHRPTGNLSAGQRRRTALARLLLTGARLWCLDEPLTSLDVEGIALVEEMVAEHLERGGLAIAATHQPLAADPARIVPVKLGGLPA